MCWPKKKKFHIELFNKMFKLKKKLVIFLLKILLFLSQNKDFLLKAKFVKYYGDKFYFSWHTCSKLVATLWTNNGFPTLSLIQMNMYNINMQHLNYFLLKGKLPLSLILHQKKYPFQCQHVFCLPSPFLQFHSIAEANNSH